MYSAACRFFDVDEKALAEAAASQVDETERSKIENEIEQVGRISHRTDFCNFKVHVRACRTEHEARGPDEAAWAA